VTPEAPLAEVVATLLERRIGSAIVIDEGRVVGVFTMVDALRALSDLLKRPE
jgi:acetoin utilization protein AcuB